MIGGNTTMIIKTKGQGKRNALGQKEYEYVETYRIKGYLDLMTASNSTTHTIYNTKLSDTSHLFICDYIDLERVNTRNSKAVIKDKEYEILIIDNPMELDEQLEIYLKRLGD